MIYQLTTKILERLDSLPKDYEVLDVGGAFSPFSRANTLIDIVSYDNINWSQLKGKKETQFSKETFVQHDICSRDPWPFADKQFDYSICSHVLEDIRDPLWVCSELIRVSKSGYLEFPSKLYEMTFGVEVNNLAGASHHRWLVDLDKDGRLRFTFKYMHAHSRYINKNRKTYDKKNPDMFLCLEWKDSFSFYENWLNSGKEIFEYYLERTISQKELWKIYRKLGTRSSLIEWAAYVKKATFISKLPFFQKK